MLATTTTYLDTFYFCPHLQRTAEDGDQRHSTLINAPALRTFIACKSIPGASFHARSRQSRYVVYMGIRDCKNVHFFWPDQTWSTSNSQYAAQYNSNISDVGSEFTFEQLGNDLFWNRWTCRTLLQPEDININCISTTLKRKCSQVFFSLTVLVTCGMHCLILLLKHFLWIL